MLTVSALESKYKSRDGTAALAGTEQAGERSSKMVEYNIFKLRRATLPERKVKLLT